MPKNSIADWSQTAVSNSDVGGINISEGCPPGNMNDMGREIMKQLADYYQNSGTKFVSSAAFAAGSASAPSIAITGDTNTGIFSPSADQIAIATGGTQRAVVDASGNVGIGTTSPTAPLQIASASTTGPTLRLMNAGTSIAAADETLGTLEFYSNDASASATGVFGRIGVYSDAAFTGGTDNDAYMSFWTGENSVLTERMRINSAGRLLVGTTASNDVAGNAGLVQVETANAASNISIVRNTANSTPGYLIFGKSRAAAAGGRTAVQANDELGSLLFAGADGTNMVLGAIIAAAVDETPGTNDMPGRLVFSTTADGASSPTERMRIDSAGIIGIGATPGTWASVAKGLQYTYVTSGMDNGGAAFMAFNARNSSAGAWTYMSTDQAGVFKIDATGGFTWQQAASGTSGTAITFSQPMTLNASGNLLLGTTTNVSGRRLVVAGGNVRFDSDAQLEWGGSTVGLYGNASTNSLTFFTATTARMTLDASGYLQIRSNHMLPYQGAPTSKSAAATLTGAELVTGILQYTGSAAIVTLPTAANIEAALTWSANNVSLDWYVIVTGAGNCTIGANSNTTVGSLVVTAGTSAHFRIRRTGSSAFTIYRLS